MKIQSYEYLDDNLRVNIAEFDDDIFEVAVERRENPIQDPAKWETDKSFFRATTVTGAWRVKELVKYKIKSKYKQQHQS
ncbi:hypothetical protein [Bacillus sp. FJAT-44742]|uniref:hypothetical protein n=1 Tax=Bacillus sp. FJAT-44742 TaxID=2014005 RepID=UPI000C250769|nr:hypothetical protein [Bacillus sp. FJAT-44742]